MAIPSFENLRAIAWKGPGGPDEDGASLLDEQEAGLTERERAVAFKEQELEESIRAARELHRGLLERMELLDDEDDTESLEALKRLPGLAPPPSSRDRSRAVDARRGAISARSSAIERRERIIEIMTEGLDRLKRSLQDCKEELNHLQERARERDARLEAAARETAERERTTGARPHAKEPAVPARAPLSQEKARSGGEEKRLLPRTRLDCEVDLNTESNFYSGFAHNVSSGGLFVATFDLMPAGSEVDLRFSLPSGTTIETRAVVRWVRDVNDLTSDVWPGMGLQFQDIPDEARAAIDRFVREREPLFFPDA